MKTSISNEQQLNIWLRKTTEKYHVICLRKNHESFQKLENDNETPTTYWRCDEIELKIPLRDNVQEYVETNFDTLFNTWLNAQELFSVGE